MGIMNRPQHLPFQDCHLHLLLPCPLPGLTNAPEAPIRLGEHDNQETQATASLRLVTGNTDTKRLLYRHQVTTRSGVKVQREGTWSPVRTFPISSALDPAHAFPPG